MLYYKRKCSNVAIQAFSEVFPTVGFCYEVGYVVPFVGNALDDFSFYILDLSILDFFAFMGLVVCGNGVISLDSVKALTDGFVDLGSTGDIFEFSLGYSYGLHIGKQYENRTLPVYDYTRFKITGSFVDFIDRCKAVGLRFEYLGDTANYWFECFLDRSYFCSQSYMLWLGDFGVIEKLLSLRDLQCVFPNSSVGYLGGVRRLLAAGVDEWMDDEKSSWVKGILREYRDFFGEGDLGVYNYVWGKL